MSEEWLNHLSVGDKVVVSFGRCETSYTVGVVEKITPKGFIKVDGSLYSPITGRQRGGDDVWGATCWLEDPDDKEVQKRVDEYQKTKFIKSVMKRIRNLRLNEVTYEQAVKLKELFDL